MRVRVRVRACAACVWPSSWQPESPAPSINNNHFSVAPGIKSRPCLLHVACTMIPVPCQSASGLVRDGWKRREEEKKLPLMTMLSMVPLYSASPPPRRSTPGTSIARAFPGVLLPSFVIA